MASRRIYNKCILTFHTSKFRSPLASFACLGLLVLAVIVHFVIPEERLEQTISP